MAPIATAPRSWPETSPEPWRDPRTIVVSGGIEAHGGVPNPWNREAEVPRVDGSTALVTNPPEPNKIVDRNPPIQPGGAP